MAVYAIRQTVAIGSRFASTTLPTTTATVAGEVATFASSAQGGLFVFADATTGTPPKNGDTYTVAGPGITTGLRVSGNGGDAATVAIYVGVPGSLRLVDTVTLASPSDWWWEQPITLLADEVVALVDAGGGVTVARSATVVRGTGGAGAAR